MTSQGCVDDRRSWRVCARCGVRVGRVEVNSGPMDQLWQTAEYLYIAFVTYFGRLLPHTEH
jgi:hypothetical protein